VTAVASYLHARQANGQWLVRIEDIDPPREVPGAAVTILKSLEQLGLLWDRSVLYQSTRIDAYRGVAERLLTDGLSYPCSCTRTELGQITKSPSLPAPYPGICREKRTHVRATGIRVRADGPAIRFTDSLQGTQHCAIESSTGDYVIWRRDGLPAYHLAVVLDDAKQGVSHVVRGADLLGSTPVQIHLQRTLGLATPDYAHVPLIVNAVGQKLSKQTGAAAIEPGTAMLVPTVLNYLGLNVPAELRGAPPSDIWPWAIAHWRPGNLRGSLQRQQ
jgi:glutamyl-Q tRNA(Asp) synthetase